MFIIFSKVYFVIVVFVFIDYFIFDNTPSHWHLSVAFSGIFKALIEKFGRKKRKGCQNRECYKEDA